MAMALISYAHEGAEHESRVLRLSERLRQDGVECEIDQYHDAPPVGWPTWMSEQILDENRFVLVGASPGYARRWSLAERRGVGLGAKWEGRLIRQRLYSSEALNGHVIPIVFGGEGVPYIPPELRDTTRYDVSTDEGYDRLLRRLTGQPATVASPVGEPARLLERQTAPLAAVFHVLQHVAAPLPGEVLCEAVGIEREELDAATESATLGQVLHERDGGLFTTTYYRSVHPVPPNRGELQSRSLDALLSHFERRGPYAATRDQLRNVVALAEGGGVRPDIIARVFGVAQKPLKRLGDKRLVWRTATLSLEATTRPNRREQDAKEEALILICGRSWVLQRVGQLDEAKVDAKRSLELGEKLQWHRNTAFCLKCLGRLSRMQAEAAPVGPQRAELLKESERYLRQAIDAFACLNERDSEEEVGECYSLLGRTLLVGDRLREVDEAVTQAESRLVDSDSKEYLDLQILRGDRLMHRDSRAAESYYSEVIDQDETADAQYSEIRARAYYARGLCRARDGRRREARNDFKTAADMWGNLEDPGASLAGWEALLCEDDLPIDPELVERESPAVRVRVVELQRERLESVRGRPARRKVAAEKVYVDRLIGEARRQVAIAETDWIAKMTKQGRRREME